MNIVIIHDGPKEHGLALTGVIAALQRQHTSAHILIATNPENHPFYQFNKSVTVADLSPNKDTLTCDLLIDYGGSDKAVALSLIYEPTTYRGLLSREQSVADQHAFRGLYLKSEVPRNLFQLLFGVAGLKWKGEGYYFRYYPRAKQTNDSIGIAVRDQRVRSYLYQRLKKDESRLWQLPFKINVLKQFDEVNKAASVVTDDPFVMHVALCLRKHVELLIYDPPTIKPEFFGNGCLHLVPDTIRGPVSGVEE
jgi:hypothetical protein